MSVIWGNGLSFAVIPKFNEWVRVMTTASDVSDSNWRRKHLERACYRERAGFAKLRMGPCLNRKLIHFCGIFFNLCVQIVCIAAAQKRY